MNTKVMFSSDNNNWETPKELFEELNNEFHFTYDLAATKENALCKNYFCENDDSLSLSWNELNGWLWLNPPYGRELKYWISKCDEESQKGAKIVCLLPARTDTSYFHDNIHNKYQVRFLRGRLKFSINGEKKDAAPFPSMIVIFEKRKKGIWSLFS